MKMYCIFLKDPMGKAPVRLVYIVPVLVSTRAAKQNISCTDQTSWIRDMWSTLAWAVMMLDYVLRVNFFKVERVKKHEFKKKINQ